MTTESLRSDEISSLMLERYRSGDLPDADARLVRSRLEASEDLRLRLAELEASDREILAQSPPAEFARLVATRARVLAEAQEGERAQRPAMLWRSSAALAAVLLLAFGLSLRTPGSREELPPATDRTKGAGLEILVFRRAASGNAERLSPGDTARPGDVIQLAYRAPGRGYGVLVSVDGRGVVTRHLPATGAEAQRLSASGTVALETAYRLDAAPSFERFFLVTADEPFSADSVVEAARGAGARALTLESLPLVGRAQTSFLIRKDIR